MSKSSRASIGLSATDMKSYAKLLRWLTAGVVFVTPTAAYALPTGCFPYITGMFA